jgi:hypothetical protein
MNHLDSNPAHNSAEVAKGAQQWAYVIVSEAKQSRSPSPLLFRNVQFIARRYRALTLGDVTCEYAVINTFSQSNNTIEDQSNGGLTLVMPRI